MNYKAQLGNQLMVFIFFLLLIIITVGIIAGTIIFFGEEYDFREIDADSLNYKLKNCLSKNEIDLSLLNSELLSEIKEKCSLSLQENSSNLLLILKLNDKQILKAGKGDETQCSLSNKSTEFPKCSYSSLTEEEGELLIITGSSQKKSEKLA